MDSMIEMLQQARSRSFVARPYYEPLSDSLIFYAKRGRSYGKRINNLLTLFLSVDDNKLVGLEIKGVKRIARLAKTYGIIVEDNRAKMKIGVLVGMAAAEEAETPEYDQHEPELRQWNDVEVPEEELAMC